MLNRNIDVSHHQGSIDWDLVVADEVTCAIVKCIDGRLPDVDRRFTYNWRSIVERRDRLVIGSCAFARPHTGGGGEEDGRAEALDYARTMLEQSPPDDWIAMVDLEAAGMDEAHSVQQNIDFLTAWVETCEAELGRTPMLYTGTNVSWVGRARSPTCRCSTPTTARAQTRCRGRGPCCSTRARAVSRGSRGTSTSAASRGR